MGVATLALAAVSTAFGFMGSLKEQDAIEAQAEAQAREFERQQAELEAKAREDRSATAREADKRMAAALAAMEASGGAGSQNEARIQQEIAGTKAVDLARISSNQMRAFGVLKADARAARKDAELAIQSSRANFLSGTLGTLGGLSLGGPGTNATDTSAASRGFKTSSFTSGGQTKYFGGR